MPQPILEPAVEDHFDGRAPQVRAIYDRILTAARRHGEVTEDPKKTSIHLNRKTAFAGIATRRESLILTLKLDRDLPSPRIAKHERASAHRWHLEIRLTDPGEVDSELQGWIEEAFRLAKP
jgi:hypothetical protein